MTAKHTGIAVLEGKWWRGWNSSVQTTFSMFAEMTVHDSHAYHYEMTNSIAALNEAIPRIASDRKFRYLYLATHGGPGGLHLINGEEVKISHLKRLFSKLPIGSRFHGLYFASCSIGTEEAATKLLRNTELTWIAGYQRDVGWVQSTALDILFFNELLAVTHLSESNAIKEVARRLRMLASGLVSELGFGLFVESRGQVIDLLSEIRE